MLAARSRGLGTVLTSFHLMFEREAAELLGIPYEQVMQAALVPVAYTKGTDFKPGRRAPLETMVHWEELVAGSLLACDFSSQRVSAQSR